MRITLSQPPIHTSKSLDGVGLIAFPLVNVEWCFPTKEDKVIVHTDVVRISPFGIYKPLADIRESKLIRNYQHLVTRPGTFESFNLRVRHHIGNSMRNLVEEEFATCDLLVNASTSGNEDSHDANQWSKALGVRS